MDAHPVPQNVTSFQFRLIGDMTLKQFGYLAGGVGFAYLIFVTAARAAPFVAWPIIVISSFLGIAFAFFPIQDRPLDHWVVAFLKAIYSPTKREWRKNGKKADADPSFKNRLNVYLTVQQAMAMPLISDPVLANSPAFAPMAKVAPPPPPPVRPVTPPPPVNPLPPIESKPEPVKPEPARVEPPVQTAPTPPPPPPPPPIPVAAVPKIVQLVPTEGSASTTPITANNAPVSLPTTPLPPISETPPPPPPAPMAPPPPPAAPPTPIPVVVPPPQIIAPPQIPITPPVPQVSAPLPSPEELSKTVELGQKAQALQVKIIETERELSRIKTQASTAGVDSRSYTQQFNVIFDNLQKLVAEASMIKRQLETVTKEPTIQKPRVKVEVVVPKSKQTQIVLTSIPNVINGIVLDPGGNYLEGVVVVIHDKEGLPVRALKTNKLGQFTGSTPLPNGTYNVELEKDNYIFDVLQITLNGSLLQPVTVSAKNVGATS